MATGKLKLTKIIIIMKKNLLFLLAGICLVLAGCSTGGNETSDLKMYELKGNVKSVKATSTTNGIESLVYQLEFDEKGLATTHRYDNLLGDGPTISVERNEKGQVTAYVSIYPDAEIANVDAQYTYDSNGLLTTIEALWDGESNTKEMIEYNEKNDRAKTVTEFYDYDQTTVEEVEYIYTNFDQNGNWIEREAKVKSYTKDFDDIQELSFTEKREIIYY